MAPAQHTRRQDALRTSRSRVLMARLAVGAIAALFLAAAAAAMMEAPQGSRLPTKSTMKAEAEKCYDSMADSVGLRSKTYRQRMQHALDDTRESMQALENSMADATDAGRKRANDALQDMRRRLQYASDTFSQYSPDLDDLRDGGKKLEEAANHGYDRLESASQDMSWSLKGLGRYIADTTSDTYDQTAEAAHKAYDQAVDANGRLSDALARARTATGDKAAEAKQSVQEAYDSASDRFDELSEALSRQAGAGASGAWAFE